MRVLVRYSPKERIDVYDGTRLRKSLKNCLHVANIDVVESYSDLPNIIHFISPFNEKEAVDARSLPTVVSALYSENDPYSRYLEKKADGSMGLSKRAVTLLRHANLVLVPSIWAKETLLKAGIKTRIEIVPPSLSYERFYGLDYATKDSFYHYYMVEPGREHIIVKGDLDDEEGLVKIAELASKLPELDFYFFGLLNSVRTTSDIKYYLNVNTPTNLRFCDPNNDDLFRSGLCNASFYLSLSYRHNDSIGVYEAFAANVQILRLGPALKGDILEDESICYGADDVDSLVEIIKKYRLGELKTTIISAKRISKESTAEIIGARIKNLYQELLKE